jgi:hypothetical protein
MERNKIKKRKKWRKIKWGRVFLEFHSILCILQHWLQGVANWFSEVDRFSFCPWGHQEAKKW